MDLWYLYHKAIGSLLLNRKSQMHDKIDCSRGPNIALQKSITMTFGLNYVDLTKLLTSSLNADKKSIKGAKAYCGHCLTETILQW